MRVFALCNNKGGVTKTTTTINLAYGFARAGKRVLIIDADAQCNTTWSLLHEITDSTDDNLYSVLMKKQPLHEVIRATDEPNLFIVPSTLAIEDAEVQLYQEDMRERKLRIALKKYHDKFDCVLIDTPPNLGLVTVNAMMASTDIIIPITLSEYALVGIGILLRRIRQLKTNAEENDVDAPFVILGTIVSMARDTIEARNQKSKIIDFFGDLVIDPSVPLNVKVDEANNPSNKGSLFDYAPDSPGAIAYQKIIDATLARIEDSQNQRAVYLERTNALLASIPN